MAIQCEMYPKVGNEDSKLYKELIKLIKDRPLTNLIYACYLQQGVDTQMKGLGYKTNSQGQHSGKDVMQYFDVYSMKNEAAKVSEVAMRIGARDQNGNQIDFTDSEDALNKAMQANNTYNRSTQSQHTMNGVVAFVERRGDKFNILTLSQDSRTQERVLDVQKQMAIWQAVKQAFQSIGVDLSTFDFNRELINAINGKNLVTWASNLRNTRNDLFSQREVRTILSMDENSSQVQRLKTMFGSMDEVAAKVYEAYHTSGRFTQHQMALIDSAMNQCKRLQGLDTTALMQQVAQIESNLESTSVEAEVQKTLDDLNRKYDLDYNEIHRKGERIKTLSDAAADAAFTLKRQLARLKSEQGVTPEAKKLEISINRITREISNKQYYSGIMGFLGDALTQVRNMEALYVRATQAPGTTMERSIERAKALMEIKRIQDGYKAIIDALSRIDDILIDESISGVDKQNIKDQADSVKEIFDAYDNKVKDLRENTMIDIATEYLGDSAPNGTAIADIVTMAEADSTVYDHLYSVGRVSNPLIATMGTIIRDAQSERNQKMQDIAIRIRRATRALYKSGSNTDFMYESVIVGYTKDKKTGKDVPITEYRVISDINWDSYLKERRRARSRFEFQGKKGLALEEAMEQWQDQNTEDRIVDFKSNRTEKVPNSNYRKAFPTLTKEQRIYHDEMMQLKGELGTLLPSYAQKQYLPPQRRRTFIDAIAKSKGNPKLIAKAILNKMRDLFTIREDDTLDVRNGIIQGEEYGIRSGAMDNTPYRSIPIFYVNRIKDQGELLKDFSGALQSLASTAINYECMNKIKDTVEFMGDFIKDQSLAATEKGTKQVDTIVTKGIRMFKNLVGFASNTNTAGIIEGFIDKHIYGVKLKDVNKWTKLAQSLLKYTSVRSLAVNLKGAIANYLVGELQMLIESGSGEFYNPLDYAWAHAQVFGGDNFLRAPGRIMDFMTNNVNSMPVLLAQRFDPLNEIFDETAQERYFKGGARNLVAKDFTFIGYGMGEHMIHYVTMYAVLHNTKVRIDGKERNNLGLKYTLYDAFEKGNKQDGNSELLLKNNVEYKDENGNWVPVDDTYLDKIRDRIRYCNQSTHGSMNDEDKGLIHQKMMGRFVMNLRQWMVEHYSRRYRGMHWDASLKEYREGYYNTVGRLFTSWARAMFKFESEYATRWSEMNTMQRANCRRAFAEHVVLFSLLGLSFGLGEPEDHKKEYWYRMWIYQTKRAIMEVNASVPLGIPQEVTKMINSPIAATNTVNALLYPFMGLPHITETLQSGRYKGWNKYGRNMLKYWAPFYNQVDQLIHLDEDDAPFGVFEYSIR